MENPNYTTFNPPKHIIEYSEFLLRQQVSLIKQFDQPETTSQEKEQINQELKRIHDYLTSIFTNYNYNAR